MPNVFCERCDVAKCRSQCLECNKFACGGCRFNWKDEYICRFCFSRRIRPIRTSEVILTRRDEIWGDQVRRLLNEVYERAGYPGCVHLYSIVSVVFTIPTATIGNGVLRDQYVRIGKHYYHARYLLSEQMIRQERTRVRPMFLSEEQKESISKEAMRPQRLASWLEKGWESEWDHVFG
jgi:hypothetical protein